MTKLFIIGNGFDIHHGIRSRYTDFADWLETIDREVHQAVEEFLPTWVDAEGNLQKAWSDLENNLEHFDTDQLLEYGSSLTVSVGVKHAPSATRDHLANDPGRSQQVAKESSRSVRLPWVPGIKPEDTP